MEALTCRKVVENPHLEPDTGDITDGVAPPAETSDQHLVLRVQSS
jgi:hypothetical protein